MILSKSGFKINKLSKVDDIFPAQDMLMQTNQIKQFTSGIYALDTVPFYLQKNIEEVTRKHLNKNHCVETQMPLLQPKDIWEKSGRWERYVKEDVMLQSKAGDNEYCLAPTAEEAILYFAKDKLQTYKTLPVNLYQFGQKFRNEIRNRGYLFRGKVFYMMDSYSFDKNAEDMKKSYELMRKAYFDIFEELGLEAIPVAADSGAIGDSLSEEFMVLADFGEDTILYDEKTKKGFNIEILEKPNYAEYLAKEYNIHDITNLKKVKAVEIGHIFQLGNKYSASMGYTFIGNDGKPHFYEMGCYGIGISRIVGLIYENSVIRDENQNFRGVSLPKNLSYYKYYIVVPEKNEELLKNANDLYQYLYDKGIYAILDDSDSSFGAKIRNAGIYGVNDIIIFNSRLEENKIQLEYLNSDEKKELNIDDFKSL